MITFISWVGFWINKEGFWVMAIREAIPGFLSSWSKMYSLCEIKIVSSFWTETSIWLRFFRFLFPYGEWMRLTVCDDLKARGFPCDHALICMHQIEDQLWHVTLEYQLIKKFSNASMTGKIMTQNRPYICTSCNMWYIFTIDHYIVYVMQSNGLTRSVWTILQLFGPNS